MPKSITLGNGQILVGLDDHGYVRDFYFPYVGLENHLGVRHRHQIGVFVDGALHWLHDSNWHVRIECADETLGSNITAENRSIGISLLFRDVVYNEKDIFVRQVTAKNLFDDLREVKLYFNQQFQISESARGDTAYYDPRCQAVIHYKSRRVFLVNLRVGEQGFDDYSTGLFAIEGKVGTYIDAEDGVLSKNPIEHGMVDSMIGVTLPLSPKGSTTVHYWLAVGKDLEETEELNSYVLKHGPEHLLQTTEDFWHAWVNRQNFSFFQLTPEIVALFKKSLLLIRSNVDRGGAIIASGDSDMLQQGRDTYAYVWPRDAARTASALDRAGDFNVARRFFEFANDIVHRDGYFMHKYLPNRSLGSSWHPWVQNGAVALPIQEDETALVLSALWRHYALSKDLEFIEDIYNSLIKRSADFLVSYRDAATGLPKPSYDLWEEKYGVSTFTAAAVVEALAAAARFADLLGKSVEGKRYRDAAEHVRGAILEHLYCKEKGLFCKLFNATSEGVRIEDTTVDMSSFFGLFKFNILPADDERLTRMAAAVEERLRVKTAVGGYMRYEDDQYYRADRNGSPNPWFVTTFWMAQYHIKKAQTESDLAPVKDWLSWGVRHALPSGTLSEQLHPHTGAQLSASPLSWSHAEFVITVIEYLEKLEEMGLCVACNPVK